MLSYALLYKYVLPAVNINVYSYTNQCTYFLIAYNNPMKKMANAFYPKYMHQEFFQ